MFHSAKTGLKIRKWKVFRTDSAEQAARPLANLAGTFLNSSKAV